MIDAGSEVPDELWPPPIIAGYEEWLSAFFELSNDRAIGMAVGPIPASSISKWCEGWSYDETVMFRTCIRAMDQVYLSQAKEAGSGKPAPPTKEMSPDMMDAIFG